MCNDLRYYSFMAGGKSSWSRAAANAESLPEAEPGAMGEPVIMLAIRRREIAGSERSRVGNGHNLLEPFDVGDGLFNVHPSQYVPEGGRRQTVGLFFRKRWSLGCRPERR